MTSHNGTVNDATREAAEQGRAAGEKGASELRNFFRDVEDLLASVSPLGDADTAKLRAKVADSIQTARESALRGSQRFQDMSMAAIKSADGYVRDNPWTIVGVSALVGLAVGVSIARR